MIANIESAIKALGDYEFVIDGNVNSQSDWDNNVRFISGADENDHAIFTDTKPVTYAEVTAKLSELEVDAKWYDIREKRNKLLAETDFYALSDVTMTTEMSNYRQALRDLPSTTSNPDDVVFPTKP
jgi:primase-polymerase (primpol)-like protein